MPFYAYMLKCADGTIYSGYTTDLPRRIAAHNKGTGAKYTRPRRPIRLAYYEELESKRAAMQREAAFKQMTHAQKQQMISHFDCSCIPQGC